MRPRSRSATSSYSAWRRIGPSISDAQVGRADVGVRRELGGGALEAYPPGLDDGAAPGDLERLAQVLLDEEHGHPAAVQLGDGRHDLVDEQRREAEARLVEHEELRL